VKVQAMTKERDEFAKLALERGKALEVSQLPLVGLNIELEIKCLCSVSQKLRPGSFQF